MRHGLTPVRSPPLTRVVAGGGMEGLVTTRIDLAVSGSSRGYPGKEPCGRLLPSVGGEVVFDQVSLRYPGADADVLCGELEHNSRLTDISTGVGLDATGRYTLAISWTPSRMRTCTSRSRMTPLAMTTDFTLFVRSCADVVTRSRL
jgi:hypothetical protein